MKKFWLATLGIAALVAITGIAATASLRFYETDRLNEGDFHTYQVRFAKGDPYMAMSAASQGGVDFDIAIIDPDGTEVIKSDSTDENTDWVRFTATKEGWYKVKITAFKGAGWYELIILNTDGY